MNHPASHLHDPYGTRPAYLVRPPVRPYWLHILLFLLTVLTTLIVGARLQENFAAGDSLFLGDNYFFPLTMLWRDPRRLIDGMPFSLTLLGILMAHEMGHYLTFRNFGVPVSLPLFVPGLGAFVSSPMTADPVAT